MEATKIAIFRGKRIRKTLYKNEWWFSMGDVVEALTDTPIVPITSRKCGNENQSFPKGGDKLSPPLLLRQKADLRR